MKRRVWVTPLRNRHCLAMPTGPEPALFTLGITVYVFAVRGSVALSRILKCLAGY
jgi:hypothetical protein